MTKIGQGNICCEVWTSFKGTFKGLTKFWGFWGSSAPPYSQFCTLKTLTFDPKPFLNPGDAFGNKLLTATYCSHSQANGDQGDFEDTYTAHPDCFQDIFTLKF